MKFFRSGIFFSLANKAQNTIFNKVKAKLVRNLKLGLVFGRAAGVLQREGKA